MISGLGPGHQQVSELLQVTPTCSIGVRRDGSLATPSVVGDQEHERGREPIGSAEPQAQPSPASSSGESPGPSRALSAH